MAKEQYMITTVDNPYNPFDDYDNWLMYDITSGYNTNAYLARIARTSDELTDIENEERISEAIDEILRYDVLDLYRKVTKDSKCGEKLTPTTP